MHARTRSRTSISCNESRPYLGNLSLNKLAARLGTPGTHMGYSEYSLCLLAKYGVALDLAQDVYAGTDSLADELVVADICSARPAEP